MRHNLLRTSLRLAVAVTGRAGSAGARRGYSGGLGREWSVVTGALSWLWLNNTAHAEI